MGRAVIRMPEYITREAMLRWVREFRSDDKGLASAIINAPSAEGVVPVVRCKSCVYARLSERNQSYYCQRRWAMHKVRERDFCSYGERRVTTCD